jgi:uncharacterized membrane protein YccC
VTLPPRVQAALQHSSARPAIAQGIRAGVATTLPLVVGVVTGHAFEYTWVALGAFQASLADNGGPYRLRAIGMSAIVVGGSLGVLVGSVASRWIWAAVPLAFLAAFVSGMVRVYGSNGAIVGVNNLVVTLVALSYPVRGLAIIGQRVEYFFIGAALSALVALFVWPFQPTVPARWAVAGCFDQLAELMRVYRAMPGSPDHATDAWHALPQAQRFAVRTAIEVAREQVGAVRLSRDGEMRRGEQLLALLVVAERLFGLTYPLPDLMDTSGAAGPGPAADALSAALGEMAGRLDRVSALVRSSIRRTVVPAAPAVNDASLAHVPEELAHLLRQSDEEVAIAEPVAMAMARGGPMPNLASYVLEARGIVPPRGQWFRAAVALLRDNWGFSSTAFLHAVRLAVGVSAAEALAITTGLPRGYWLTVTTGIILQPYAGATVERAIQRVLGTVAGVLVAAAITAVLHAPLALTLILFPLTVLTFAVRPINYGYFVLFLTPIFVLLAEGLHSDPRLAIYRLVNTVLGGVLATVIGAVLFPAWEREGLASELARAVDGDREYLRSVVGQSSTPEHVARRAMGLANGNAEVAVQRIAAEGKRSLGVFVAGTTAVTVLRRLGAAVSAIAALRATTPDADAGRLAEQGEGVLSDLAAALREGRAPVALPAWPAVDEARFPLAPLLVRQIDVLHAAVERFEEARVR